MPPAPAPPVTAERVAALAAAGLFEPGTVPAFDRLARVAVRALGGSFALVSLLGARRQVVKGRAGAAVAEGDVVEGIGRRAAGDGAPLVIADAAADARVRDLPAVRDGGVRAYVGVPLRDADGVVVGSFAVGDRAARAWTDDDVATLADLAASAGDHVAAGTAARGRDAAGRVDRGGALFRALFDDVSQLTGLLAPDGTVVEANRTALDFAGRPRGAVLGRPLWESLALPAGMEARHRAAVARAAAGEAVRYEETVWDAGGRERVLDVALRPALGEAGLLLLEGRDVTGAVRVRRVQLAMMAGLAGTWDLDLDAGAVTTHGGTDLLFGLDPADRPRAVEDYFERVHPDDVGRVRAAIAAAAGGGGYEEECRTVHPDGTVRWVRARGTASARPGGAGRIVGAVVDVTDERRRADASARAAADLQLALDAAGMGRWEGDLARGPVEQDARARALHGAAPGDGPVPFEALVAAVHPDDRARTDGAYAAAAGAGPGARFDVEYRATGAGGAVRWVRSSGRVRDTDDGPRIAGVVWDVTAEREAEDALRESEERLRFALDVAGLGQWDLDLETGAAFRSARHDEIFGYPAPLASWTYADFLDHVAPADRDRVDRAFQAAQAEGGTWALECEVRRADGAPAWVAMRGRVWLGEGGAPRRMVGTVADVTERVRAEAALREADRQKTLLLDLQETWRTTDDPDAILAAAAEAVGRHLGAHRAGFLAVDGDALDFGAGPSWTDGPFPPLAGAVPVAALSADYLAEVRAGRTLGIDDAETSPLTAGTALLGLGARSGVGAPIVRDGAWEAGLYVHHAEPRAWSEAEVALVGEVAGRAWEAVRRARAGRALAASEGRFRALLDATNAVVYTKDAAGRYTLVNRAWADLFGVPPEDAIGRADADFFRPDEAAALAQNDRRVLETGAPLQFEETADVHGERRTYLSVKFPLRGAGGAVEAVGGISTDITPLRRATEALAESEARFRGTFANAAVGIAHVGLDGAWLRANDRLSEIVGYDPEELLGLTFQAITHPDDLEADLDQFGRLVAGELDHYQIEKRYVHRDGHTVWINLTVAPSRAPDGEIEYVISVVEDVSDRRAAEDALRALNDELEDRVAARTAELARSNAELDQFAYVASHDLKAPIRAIDSLAVWIEEDAGDVLPPESARHLALLQSRAGRMERLLDSLLAYSRAGRSEAAPEAVDTGALARDVVETVAPPGGFDVRFEGDFPTLVTARAPLALVLRNLVGNAIKHHDRPDGRVTVSAAVEGDADGDAEGGGRVRFAVEDDGPGVAPAYRDRVFGMFQTLRPRDEVEGSGMGLAIVKKTVESRGGAVDVGAADGGGARFTFTWPLRAGPHPAP